VRGRLGLVDCMRDRHSNMHARRNNIQLCVRGELCTMLLAEALMCAIRPDARDYVCDRYAAGLVFGLVYKIVCDCMYARLLESSFEWVRSLTKNGVFKMKITWWKSRTLDISVSRRLEAGKHENRERQMKIENARSYFIYW